MLSYAGYRLADGTVIGDPQNVEITDVICLAYSNLFPCCPILTLIKNFICLQICIKLGWKGKMTPWDILPWVLSANGHDPDYFDIPDELVLQVPLTHPT